MFSKRIVKVAVLTPLSALTLLACAHIAMMKNTPKPAASEFGYGPRVSANQLYRVSIEETQKYKVGKLQSTVIRVETVDGKPVDGAVIEVGGGMPQHGHGLPTRPRVTEELGNGRYRVSGLKFNMGGWWELKFAINGGMSDNVTFNLEL